jgi:hypothetical protein
MEVGLILIIIISKNGFFKGFEVIHMDEYVDELLNSDACLDVVLTRIPKRAVYLLEEIKKESFMFFDRFLKTQETLNQESVL